MLPHAVPPSHPLDTSAAVLGYSHLLDTAADEDPIRQLILMTHPN